jgi:stage II sporulation protein D
VRVQYALGLMLLIAGCASAPPATVPPPTPVPTGAPPTSPTPFATPLRPMPTAVPTVPAPSVMPNRDTDPPLVRVLLQRSAGVVELPQPGRAYRLNFEGRTEWMWGPLKLRVAAAGPRWWQVGAWSDPANASVAAEKIRGALGAGAGVRVEPASGGLTRVRVGWSSAEPPDPAASLAALGFEGVYSVPATGELRIEGSSGGVVTSSEEVLIEPAGEWPVVVGGWRRYRGRVRARAVGNETLVINELNMESYLKGVVPVEMGPSQFPKLDALKAQAVAARTYAVAHLGDHDNEGWDLCATPACQAYYGRSAEHSLSNRAVEETAGLVAAYMGRPIDAMYTSTCGGHTEDAAVLFEDRAQPYLVGVPCAWERPISLTGTSDPAPWVDATAFSAAVAREVLGLEPRATPAAILARVLEWTGVTAQLLAPNDVESFAAAALAAVGVDPPVGIAPAVDGLERLLFLTDLYKIPLDPPIDELDGNWPAAAVMAALELRGDVVRDSGEAVPRPGGAGIFPRRAEHGEDLPSPLPLWERWSDGFRQISSAEVLPGTVLERIRVGDRLAALVVRRSGGDDEADRRSAWREWVREKSWTELRKLTGVPTLERLTVNRRSRSGRVVGLVAVGAGGVTTEWTGFEIRRVLELPETLFAMHLRTGPDGEKMVHFLGRGWGHGIGLCQNGAYGLARAGMTFDRILGHYYTGIEIVRWDGLQSTQ